MAMSAAAYSASINSCLSFTDAPRAISAIAFGESIASCVTSRGILVRTSGIPVTFIPSFRLKILKDPQSGRWEAPQTQPRDALSRGLL